MAAAAEEESRVAGVEVEGAVSAVEESGFGFRWFVGWELGFG